jgi:hypothetical protein
MMPDLDRFFFFGDCRIVIDNESSAEATIVRVYMPYCWSQIALDFISVVSKFTVLVCSHPC